MKQTRITPALTEPICVTELGHGIEIWEFSELRAQVRTDGTAIYQFYGETAWADAVRYGSDLIIERIYA